MIHLARDVDVWAFFYGAGVLLLPVLTARLTRKTVVLILPGSDANDARAQFGRLVGGTVSLVTKLNCRLAHRIVLYSANLVGQWKLSRFDGKIRVADHHAVDLSQFRPIQAWDKRPAFVGYVGRFSKEKGFVNFLDALPHLIQLPQVQGALVAGTGPLKAYLDQQLQRPGFGERVICPGWIPHGQLPQCLNDLMLLVIPSYSEGEPLIALEAMACGTPVLAAPVGHLPDIVKDGVTGFILEGNSPYSIAHHVERALTHPALEEVSANARALMEASFSFESSVRHYRQALDGLFQARPPDHAFVSRATRSFTRRTARSRSESSPSASRKDIKAVTSLGRHAPPKAEPPLV
jgi:glycosyltransferase involved in cell wall biosynthesis